MNIQLHPFALVYLNSALGSAAVAAVIWRRRSAPGAVSLFVNMLAVAWWSMAYIAMWASTTLRGQEFWLHSAAFGVLLAPLTFFTFSLQVSGNDRLVTRRLVALLLLEPLIFLFLLWTNEAHHLVYSRPQLWSVDGLNKLIWSPGPIVWADTIYSNALILAGIWFLARSLRQGSRLLRTQTQTILLGAFFSLFSDFIYFTPIASILNGLDTAPLAFAVAGGIYFYAITYQKFLDLIPVARSQLIESMADGVIVADLQDRVVDINPAAEQFLGVTAAQAIGRRTRDVFKTRVEVTKPFWDQLETRTEIVVAEEINRYVDLIITPLMDSHKCTTGRLIVFRDVTARRQDEAALREVNEKLQEQLDEIRTLRDQLHEKATRDPLTNLYNRRYLEDALAQELARAGRENYSVCLIMMDIDRFKRVNDTCGHKTGDETLKALAHLLVSHIRRFDMACRYGGEEFIIVMPHLSGEVAYERTEFLRKEFARLPLPCGNLTVHPTLSIGIAIYPAHGADGEQLIQAADKALYAAKSSGRNRTVIHSEEMVSSVRNGV